MNFEEKAKELNLNSNRVTKASIEAKITSTEYYVFPNTTVTICLITLQNGFNVHGYSACADKENFRKELGEELAFKNAFDKIWQLEGYLLKEKLFV